MLLPSNAFAAEKSAAWSELDRAGLFRARLVPAGVEGVDGVVGGVVGVVGVGVPPLRAGYGLLNSDWYREAWLGWRSYPQAESCRLNLQLNAVEPLK